MTPRPLRSPCALALLLLGSCVNAPKGGGSWEQELMADVGEKIGGCVVGDLRADLPGNEVALVTGGGLVYVLHDAGEGWEREVAAALEGEAIQCAAGDVLPDAPGLELVTVGMLRGSEDDPGEGLALLHRRTERGWERSEVHRSSALLHAVCVGDADPTHRGHEVVVAGYARELVVCRPDGAGWVQEVVAELPAAAKGVSLGLGGIVVACDDGTLLVHRRRSGGWEQEVLFRGLDALARVASTGEVVLFCGNDGKLRLWYQGQVVLVHGSSDRLRGAVLADLVPERRGLEGATAGYDGLITVARGGPIAWSRPADHQGEQVSFERITVGSDTGRLHHLAAGELPGRGTCLVAVGYSGHALLVRHRAD